MKKISFSELDSVNFALSDVSVIYQTPQWTSLGGLGEDHGGRKLNGFLLIDSGKCVYEWLRGEAELSRGNLIYLPSGAKRYIRVTEREFSFYRIDFKLTDTRDGENIVFDSVPYVAMTDAGQNFFDICEKMKESTFSSVDRFRSASLLFELFHVISRVSAKKGNSRISTALRYIEKHYNDPLDVRYLAELCYLSEPHFFRIFKNETGTTPIALRNKLRIERAKSLLSDGECQIGEIASMLGFESIYYFSRAFKNAVGISPLEYKEKN